MPAPDGPRRVVLALAMPIDADAGQLTNRAWRFDPAMLRHERASTPGKA